MPVEKQAGDALIGATLNGSGSMLMHADRVGEGTLLPQTVRMVGGAHRSRALIQELADAASAAGLGGAAALDESALVRLAAGPEQGSEHPLAAAIVEAAQARKLDLVKATEFTAKTGKGVTGTIEGRHVALGNAALLADLKVDAGGLAARAETTRHITCDGHVEHSPGACSLIEAA